MLLKKSLKNFAFIQIAIYSMVLVLAYWPGRTVDFGFSLVAFLMIGTFALLSRKAWGRKIILVGSVVGVVYGGWQLFSPSSIMGFVVRAIFVITCLAVLFYYNKEDVKKCFSATPGHKSWTVLVIDDDRMLLKLLKTNFERYNIATLTAETGEQGLDLAQQVRPDLIVLDVILPKMKGREVCVKLKENPRTKEIPVIFLTAKNSLDDVHAEMDAGAHAHITKPVDFQDLFLQIKNILNM